MSLLVLLLILQNLFVHHTQTGKQCRISQPSSMRHSRAGSLFKLLQQQPRPVFSTSSIRDAAQKDPLNPYTFPARRQREVARQPLARSGCPVQCILIKTQCVLTAV